MTLLGRIFSSLIPVLLGLIFIVGAPLAQADENSDKRADLEHQLQQLETESQQLDKVLQDVSHETVSLTNETLKLNAEIKRKELELQRLSLVIRKAELEIKSKGSNIGVLSGKIDKNRKVIAAGLLALYARDQDSLMTILFKNKNLSNFFTSIYHLEKVQASVQDTLVTYRDERSLLQKEKSDLETFEEDQQDLKALQDVERRALAQKKAEKDELLRLTRGKEALFQQLLKNKKRDIATLKTQLFYLEKTGITAENAIQFADLAAKRAGIRTAFLLALLEVETGKQFEDGVISVGTNLGTGSWKRDLYDCYISLGRKTAAESEKKAFFAITGKLSFDPDNMPVSRKPNYGCGGAMGPAQFLPTTWLRFESRVSQLTGHNPPNPWNIEDAFTAAAVFLADSGADLQTTAGETAAAKTYISGQPNCTKYICKTYSSRIISLAKDIDRIL